MMPRVVAHRGASVAFPEQTLAAYAAAIACGADGLECDIHLSADGVPVCIHDDTIDRTAVGSGVVAELTLAELRRYRFDRRRPDPAAADYRSEAELHTLLAPPLAADPGLYGIATLADLLQLAASAGRRLLLLVEVKTSAGAGCEAGAGDTADPVRIVETVLGTLAAHRSEQVEVMIISFDQLVLDLVHARSAMPTCLLVEDALPAGSDGWIGPPVGLPLNQPGDAAVHAGPMYVWDANEPDEIRRLARLGVAAIGTDHVTRTRRILAASTPR